MLPCYQIARLYKQQLDLVIGSSEKVIKSLPFVVLSEATVEAIISRFSGKYPGEDASDFASVPLTSVDFRCFLTEGIAFHFTGSAEGKSEGSELPLSIFLTTYNEKKTRCRTIMIELLL